MNTLKNFYLFIALAVTCFACQQPQKPVQRTKNDLSTVILKIEKQEFAVKSSKGDTRVSLTGEILFEMSMKENVPAFRLQSLSLYGPGVATAKGQSGNLSVMLDLKSASTKFDPKTKTVSCDFLVDVHYPLIDQLKGFMEPANEKEADNFRPYTEKFKAGFTCTFKELPQPSEKEQNLVKSADYKMNMEVSERVIGEIGQISGASIIDFVIVPFYLKKFINIQPVFIRYTPDYASACCCGPGTTATTGGSYTILKEKSLEMWNRCCIGLKFLAPVYVENNDYRVLSSSEANALRASYNDPNAIEVFFVEVSDPVGIWGGGACWSGGTANAQIITFDVNLPINQYNVAHELGHALGLSHPPGNSTPGSLMEPSGFCMDNPPYMSDENCDNASNPLLVSSGPPYLLCTRKTNMP